MSLVENLRRDYGDFRLEIPRWEIPDQGITALWGPSGSGKTSVFRCLIGLEETAGMRWTFKGEDLAAMPAPDRRLGVVFQSLELFPHMSAEENIRFAARARGVGAEEAKARVRDLAAELRMESYLKRRAHVLSGGEAQRVALARAIVAQPRFLFLDEPFSSLDAELRREARQTVKQVILRRKIPTLLITHDPDDIQELAGQVVKMKELNRAYA
ncbi:MAG TPA: ATP-binding cassette domain-containing protein [Bdellovibrionales bacterium]|nr:ATP-binding cassette domain-containing protein [Bdellovibrionales bacterium]